MKSSILLSHVNATRSRNLSSSAFYQTWQSFSLNLIQRPVRFSGWYLVYLFQQRDRGGFVIPEAANNIIYIHSRACMDLEKRRTMIQQAPVKILSFCKCNRLYLFNSSSNNEYQQQEFGMRVILISWRCVKIQPDFEYSHNHATEQYDTRYMLHVRSKFLFFGQTNSLNSHH